MWKQNFGNICSFKPKPFISVCVKTLEHQLWGASILLIIFGVLLHHDWSPSVVILVDWTWFKETHVYEPHKSPWSIDLDMYAVNKRDDIGVRVLKYTHVGGWCECGGRHLHLSVVWNNWPSFEGPTRQECIQVGSEEGYKRVWCIQDLPEHSGLPSSWSGRCWEQPGISLEQPEQSVPPYREESGGFSSKNREPD